MLGTDRVSTIASVRERVTAALSTKLSDAEVVAVALASLTRRVEDVLGFLLPNHLTKLAIVQRESLKLTNDEFERLFNPVITAALHDVSSAKAVAVSPNFSKLRDRVALALRQTLSENGQIGLWARPHVQLLGVLCFHLHDAHEAMATVLGVIVHADKRRVEELVSELEDEEGDVMALATVLLAVGELA